MTAFLTVTRFIEAALLQAPAVAAAVARSKPERVEIGDDTAAFVYPENADGRAAAVRGGWHSFQFDVTVACYARAALEGADAGDAEAATDAVLAAVLERLATASPPAGVALLLARPRMAWEFIAADRNLGCCRLTFTVDLSTHNQTFALWS